MRRIRLRAGSNDDGVVLIVVLGSMIVLSLFLLATVAFAVNNLRPSGRDVAGKRAEAAAQAGVDEYIARLNTNDTYYTVNDGTNAAYTGYKTIQGTGTAGAAYTYKLLSTTQTTAATGIVRLQVTGRATTGSQAVTRTLTVNLQRKGFLSFLYATDVEALDPILYDTNRNGSLNGSDPWKDTTAKKQYSNITPNLTQFDAVCGSYYYAGRSNPGYTGKLNGVAGTDSFTADVVNLDKNNNPTGSTTYGQTFTASASMAVTFSCTNIQWASGDTVNGPLHTNDAMLIAGNPTYTSNKTETSWPPSGNPTQPTNGNIWWGSGAPASGSNKPVYAAPITLPTTNTSLRTLADPSNSGVVGCLYTGETKLTFTGSTMSVFSPATTTAPAAFCGFNVANRGSVQTGLPIPPVIYVDTASSCGSVTSVGYPMSGEDTSKGTTTDYNCLNGTAYVSGTVGGTGSSTARSTIATRKDIVVTGDLAYGGGLTGTDALGLIAANNVWVYHPVNSSGANILTGSAVVHKIDAAIFAVTHSFIVQNWNVGAVISTASDISSKLTVEGVIVQKFRGPVGTTSTGYLKNYVFDSRLFYNPPPYFLQPTSAPWGVTKITD